MQFKEPKVIIVAHTQLDPDLDALLEHVGVPNWGTDGSDAETVIEVAGRLCYRSFAPGLNPNVTKVREGNAAYIGNILTQRHGSVLEHASVTFAFLDVSRVFTHEIVRHRHLSFSQESLRYVRLTEMGGYAPEAFGPGDLATMTATFEDLEETQRALAAAHGLDDEASFAAKKRLTSAFRRLAPLGLTTNIIVTGNHRAWRDVIAQRCTEHAEEEIRKVIFEAACQLATRFPNIYQDMRVEAAAHTARFENERV